MDSSKIVKRTICILQTLIKNKSKTFVQSVTLNCLQLLTIPKVLLTIFLTKLAFSIPNKKG